MKTYTERTLEEIKKITRDKRLILSCDIYYNDLADEGEQFVVKLYSAGHFDRHFRTNHIRTSLKQALKYVKGL